MNESNKAFHVGNLIEKHRLQREIKCEIRRAKQDYKKMLERDLSTNNSGSAWDGMHTIIGATAKSNRRVDIDGSGLMFWILQMKLKL